MSAKKISLWYGLKASLVSGLISQQTHHAIMTSLLRQNDVIITSCVQWHMTNGLYYLVECGLWPFGSLWSRWWRHQMETFSALLALCAGNSSVPVKSPHKGQWRGALMFSLICVWINGWVNNREAGDLRRHLGHYDVIVMDLNNISWRATNFYHAILGFSEFSNGIFSICGTHLMSQLCRLINDISINVIENY